MTQLDAAPSAVRRNAGWIWVIAALALCHAHAIASLHVVNILVDPIKASLSISDTQFSLLQGAAVAILAGVLGLPMARIADGGRRRTVILAGLLVWSAGSLLSAFAQDFASMFAARAMVGVGEIVLFPAALSWIYDAAPPKRIAAAIGAFGAGGPLGAAAALAGGGWLVAHAEDVGRVAPWLANFESWRVAFLALAFLGVVAAAALALAPGDRSGAGAGRAASTGLAQELWRDWRAYAGVSGGFIMFSIAVLAINAWAPTYLIRVRGLDAEAAGGLVGAVAISGAVAGAWLAGIAADALRVRGRSDAAILLAIGFVGLLAVSALGLVVVVPLGLATVFLFAAYALMATPTVLGGFALQQISPPAMRAQIMALHVLLVNVIALTAGPAGVALTTDYVFGAPAAVGQSLALVVTIAAALAIATFVVTKRAFKTSAELREC
ncbi:MFS transporter [Terricaulis silvestris]|uniref:D-galactonate transporter n=1 Tax=Terricaulis silvestris TaxID=2686094 RepID=A0A6I6MGC5_9CAUL|nr:MFS transporter [Terricaulis silvestris]QGZ93650.1 D-galactonate transporter [Terricaulis silvestris]